MKKLFLILFLASNFVAHAGAIIKTDKFRWRNDDGNETSATWKAATNNPVTLTSRNQNIRLRLNFFNSPNNTQWLVEYNKFYYSKNGGAKVPVTNDSSKDFIVSSSSFVTDGDTTTNQFLPSFRFLKGYFVSEFIPSNQDSNINLPDSTSTEIEYCIRATAAAADLATYTFYADTVNTMYYNSYQPASLTTQFGTLCTPTSSTETISACNSYTWHDTLYTASNNTATWTGVNAEGCDSVVTLNLTINNSSTSSTTITNCDNYTWNGTTYTSSGTYTFNTTNAAGCDSVATLNLTIDNSTTSSTTITNCNNYTWNGTTYTTSGTYTFNTTNAAGCDSVATLNLTIDNSTTSSTTITNCDNYTWNGTTYTTSGTYTFNTTNAAGCDSVATLNLTIDNSTTSSTTITNCNNYTWNGTTYTTSGTYTFNTTNAAGCDSVATLNLNIDNSTTSSTTITNCDNYTWNGTTYTTSGTYTFNTTNAAGCDSVATLNLTIDNSTTSSTTITNCNNYTWNGTTYTTSGTYTFNTTNAAGCDSVATLNLIINTSSSNDTTVTACDSYPWNGITYTTSGTYTFNTTNAAGCDSVATLNLTINNSTTSSTTITNCGSYTWNGTAYTQSGTYTFSYTNALGCASVDTLRLTINPLPASAVGVNGSRFETGTVSLSATVTSGITVDWYAAESGGAALSTGSTSFTTPSISSTTIYYAQARNATTGCLSATRTAVTATVSPRLVVGVSISSNATNNKICRGAAVTFTATPTNGGGTPTYQWKMNGTNIFTGSTIELYNIQNNDQITVVMTTSLSAASVTSTTATSNAITITVNNLPSVVSTTPATISSCTATGSATINALPTSGSVIDWYASTSSTTPLLTSSNSYTTPSISSTTTYFPVARDTVTGCQSNGLTSQNMAINMGPNNAYIQTPKTVTGSFTIEFWLRTAGSSSAGCGSWRCGEGLVDANTGDNSDNDFGITMFNNYVAFGMGTGSTDVSIVTTTLINNRRWKHIAASWDSTTGAMRLYVNGVLEASAIGGTASRNGQSLMRLGALLQAPGNGFYGYFSGDLDEVRVWRKVRTQAEIQANYTTNLNGKEDGLAQYYNFNQAINQNLYASTQTTLYDITPNGKNGSLIQFQGLGTTGNQGTWRAPFDFGTDPAKYPVVVTKIPLPTVTSTTGSIICGEGTATISAAASAGAKIDWYDAASGGTALATGTNSFTPSISGTSVYYAEARDTVTGCVSVSRTAITATVNGLPTAVITNNTGSTELTCARTSISLTASGGSTYSWNNSLGASRNQNITSPGTYIVTAIGANTCRSTSSITITQNITAPISGITNNTGATLLNCSRTSISVTATGGSTYTWSNGLGTNANVNITAPGTYTVTAREASNGCTSTSSFIATQNIAISRTDTLVTVCNSFVWYGTNYTRSANPTRTYTNINGCDSIVTLRLTIDTPTTSIETLAACINYTWNGVTYTTSGTRTWNGTNAKGCDSVATLNLTISKSNVYTPYNATQMVVSNVCSSRVYRYTASITPVGFTYKWILPNSVGGVSGVTVDSGDINSSRTIKVRYASNEAAFLTDSIKVRSFNGCFSVVSATKLSNIRLVAPSAPTKITVTPVTPNVCSNRRYRFTAPALPAGTNGSTTTILPATGYLWTLVGNLSEFATIDSGDENSQKIVVSFSSNFASTTGDSIKLQHISSCGFSEARSSKLTNTKLNAPLAPATITITALQTNVCGARKYRYSAPSLPVATNTNGAATGYAWSLAGALSGTATIDSGNVNSRVITVTFTSNAAAATGDSIRLNYTSDCGNGARKASKLTNTLLGAPLAPASITIQSKSDVCNARTYRYIASELPSATASAGAASGYLWSAPTGTVGSTGTIDSGNVNSRIITVTYISNAAAGVGDSIRLLYTSLCGDGKIKAQKLSNLVKNGCTPIAKNGSTSRGSTTVALAMEVNVYPNPSTSVFNVQVKSPSTEEAVVRVLDITGRFIKSIKVSSNSNVNMGSDLKAGGYMLEVKQGKEVKMERVVKF